MTASPEKRIKDLEERMKNAEIRHARLKTEVDSALSGVMKAFNKHQRESYDAFRKELKASTDKERKKAVEERARIAKEYKALTVDFELTREQLRRLLR
jgi:predicted nuclease of restriction endonuclease-like RecB superfamily